MPDPSSPVTRRRRSSRLLDEDRVVSAALEVMDRGGVHALGIRAVAARLGIQPNAVYTYVPDRASLDQEIAERVLSLSRIELLTAADRPWRTRLVDYALDLRGTLLAHPGAASLLMTASMRGPTASRIGELVMATFEEAGLPPESAARSMYLLIVLVIGSVALDVAETDGRAPLPPEIDRVTARRQALSGVDEVDFPRTAAAAPVVATFVGEAQFRWALESVLDGIERRAHRSPDTG